MKNMYFNVLHVCNYAAYYRGNFIDSIESLERYHSNVNNFYLFPARAGDSAKKWISKLNQKQEVAYIQKPTFWGNVFLLMRIIRKHKINRIVRHFSDLNIDIVIKFLFGGKRVVRFFHCGCEPSSSTLKHKIKEFIWKNNKLVGVSDAVAQDLKTMYPSFDVYSIVNAINFERLNQTDEFEKACGTSLLALGWDYSIKGTDLALKAANLVRKKYDITLQIVGGKSENTIKTYTKELLGEDTDWIRFLPTTNNIGTYYHNNDIFLSPSRLEAFGYANVEAAYCKNSVVLSRVGGQKDIKIDGAYWVEPDNVEDLANKIEQALLELGSSEKIAQKERVKAEVEQTYSLKEWSNKLFALL